MLEILKEFFDEQDLLFYYEHACSSDLFDEDLSLEYVKKLQLIIQKQKCLVDKLCEALHKSKKEISTCAKGVQTEAAKDSCPLKESIWKAECLSVKDMIKEAAEDAMKKTGFVYEPTSGLYYDYNTGYYYNAELGLYYDGNSGTYMYYNETKKEFEFHSRVELPSAVENTSNKSPNESKCASKRVKKRETKTRKKVKKNGQSDVEEGECSEDSNAHTDISSDQDTECVENGKEKCDSLSVAAVKYSSDEMSKAWPPCMRIIVKETKVKSLKVGSLFLITYDGGTLGREGDHLVLIPDLNISKYHAKFNFDTKDAKNEIGNYTLTDLGSRNGTFIDGKRLSSALQESEPYPVLHDTTIRVGGTTLLCHVHAGRETCTDCEPGLLMSIDDEKRAAYVLEENMSEKRKNELKKLKKKFGFKLSGESNAAVTNTEYKDRAQIRRQTVGSHNDSFKTEVACVTQPIKKTNKGFEMLAKMGWSEGESLGVKSEEGITEPILVQQRVEKVGLGYDMPVQPELSKADKKKQDMWKKTQIRYNNLQSDSTS